MLRIEELEAAKASWDGLIAELTKILETEGTYLQLPCIPRDTIADILLPHYRRRAKFIGSAIAEMKGEPEVDLLVGKYTNANSVSIDVTDKINEDGDFWTHFSGERGTGSHWVPRGEIELHIKNKTWRRVDTEPEDELVGTGWEKCGTVGITIRKEGDKYRPYESNWLPCKEAHTKAEMYEELKNGGWTRVENK